LVTEVAAAHLLLATQHGCAPNQSSAAEATPKNPDVSQDWGGPNSRNRQQVIEHTMLPFTGVSHRGVDASTLTGKVLCGYQGWFTAQGGGAGRGWTHRGKGGAFRPGSCKADFWPDVSEMDADERYPTEFVLADGKPAEVFSAFNRKTVPRHFQWMRHCINSSSWGTSSVLGPWDAIPHPRRRPIRRRRWGSRNARQIAREAGGRHTLSGGIVARFSELIERDFVAQISGDIPPQTSPGPPQKPPGNGTQRVELFRDPFDSRLQLIRRH